MKRESEKSFEVTIGCGSLAAYLGHQISWDEDGISINGGKHVQSEDHGREANGEVHVSWHSRMR